MKHSIIIVGLALAVRAYSQNSIGVKRDSLGILQNPVGSSLPTFSSDTGGGVITNSNFAGKVVYINVWANGCKPCMAELGGLNEMYDSLRNYKNFEFVSFALGTKETVILLKRKYKIHYPVIAASETTCNILDFSEGFPTSTIIDPSGKIMYYKLGGNIDSTKARDFIMKQLYPGLKNMLNIKRQ